MMKKYPTYYTQKYKDPYSYFGYLAWATGNILTRKIESSPANAQKILCNHFMVLASLFWLTEIKETVNQRELAAYTHLREITVSTIVKKLEKRGLLTIKTDENDKRSRLLDLTQKGLQFLTGMLDDIKEKEARLDVKALEGLKDKFTLLLKMLSQ